MAKDVSIAFKASDNLTHSLQKMRKSVDGLSRDVTEYRKIQSQAFDKKLEVKLDIKEAQRNLNQINRAIKDGSEGAKIAYQMQQRELIGLQEEYKRLTKVANDASKAESRLQADMNKSNNLRSTMAAQQTSMLKNLASAGLGNMVGDALTSSVNQNITSMYGSEVGSNISSIAGGVLNGAAIGAIAGPIGSAVGAAVGGLTGAINALSEQQQRDDDRFRNEVQSLYSKVTEQQEQDLQSGSTMSSDREQLVMGLGTLLGSQEEGNKLFEEIKTFGIETPYEGTSMVNAAKQMLAYGIKAENVMDDMRMLGEVAMGDQNKFNNLTYAYAQTQSAGKLTGQDLLQYTAAGFNPLSILAEEQGRTLAELREDMSNGLISAEDVTRAFQIATTEGGRFYGAMNAQMDTYAGKMAMLNDLQAEITLGYGEGYNTKRQEGMEKEIEQLSGKLGDKMREANSLIGEFKADLENKYQQSIIDAMSSAMETDEYKMAKREDDGAEMGRIIAEARAKAEIEYQNSEGVKLLQESQMGIVQSIQADVALNSQYVEFGKQMANQFSKGYAGVIDDLRASGALSPQEINNLAKDKGFNVPIDNPVTSLSKQKGFHATGLDRVPYDGYEAVLHEGEEILTKVEADKRDQALSSGGVNINIASMVIREEADIEKLAYQLYLNLEKRAMNTSLG